MLNIGLGIDFFAALFLDKSFNLFRITHQEIIKETLLICYICKHMYKYNQYRLTFSPPPPELCLFKGGAMSLG